MTSRHPMWKNCPCYCFNALYAESLNKELGQLYVSQNTPKYPSGIIQSGTLLNKWEGCLALNPSQHHGNQSQRPDVIKTPAASDVDFGYTSSCGWGLKSVMIEISKISVTPYREYKLAL